MNEIFSANGYEAYLVGGAVRDIIRGKKASDWDIATNAKPEDVKRIFKKVIPTGIEHGTVTVHFMGAEIEVTTYRTETDYSDGRHPDAVKYAATIEEDLSRRNRHKKQNYPHCRERRRAFQRRRIKTCKSRPFCRADRL